MYLQESSKAYGGGCVRESEIPLEKTEEIINPKDEEQCIKKTQEVTGHNFGKAKHKFIQQIFNRQY